MRHLLSPDFAFLGLVVSLAGLVQTTVGFGAMLTCVTLGALVWPIPELMALLVPLSVMQAAVVVVRNPGEVDWRTLLERVLPLMGIGIAVTSALTSAEPEAWMRPALGGLVLVLAVRELFGMWRGPATGAASPAVRSGALVAAGLVHGVFATGGPIVVWSLGQDRTIDKGVLRTTLTAVWMIANAVLIVVFVSRGQIDQASALGSAALVLPALVGVALGEIVHARVDELRFRAAVWVVVGLAGLPLLA